MGWGTLVTTIITFFMKIWDWMNGWPRQKLLDKIDALEIENRQHQLNGDFEQMRRTRGQLEEARRRLSIGDYK